LTCGGHRAFQYRCDVFERQVEHIAQDEGGTFGGRKGLDHHQQRKADSLSDFHLACCSDSTGVVLNRFLSSARSRGRPKRLRALRQTPADSQSGLAILRVADSVASGVFIRTCWLSNVRSTTDVATLRVVSAAFDLLW
jgi:hypothetical protein